MRIAIIGTGISALSTAFYLDKNIDIDLYDSEDRLGGHTDTHLINLTNKEIFLIIAPGYESSIKSFTLTNGEKYDI